MTGEDGGGGVIVASVSLDTMSTMHLVHFIYKVFLKYIFYKKYVKMYTIIYFLVLTLEPKIAK